MGSSVVVGVSVVVVSSVAVGFSVVARSVVVVVGGAVDGCHSEVVSPNLKIGHKILHYPSLNSKFMARY